MGGCFKSIGCLVVAIAYRRGRWFTRALWTPLSRIASRQSASAAPAPQPGTWQLATPAGAARAQAVIERLARAQRSRVREHRARATSSRTSSSSSRTSCRRPRENVEAMVSGDQLLVRCSVNHRGPRRSLPARPTRRRCSADREKVQFGGTLDM